MIWFSGKPIDFQLGSARFKFLLAPFHIQICFYQAFQSCFLQMFKCILHLHLTSKELDYFVHFTPENFKTSCVVINLPVQSIRSHRVPSTGLVTIRSPVQFRPKPMDLAASICQVIQLTFTILQTHRYIMKRYWYAYILWDPYLYCLCRISHTFVFLFFFAIFIPT